LIVMPCSQKYLQWQHCCDSLHLQPHTMIILLSADQHVGFILGRIPPSFHKEFFLSQGVTSCQDSNTPFLHHNATTAGWFPQSNNGTSAHW